MIRKIGIIFEMIKFEHTIFALPFAFMGAILGAVVMEHRLPSWEEIGWITLAMFGARSAAMSLNRLIDKAIDLRNPRTEKRALPAGLLKSAEVLLFIVVSFALLFVATANLAPIALKLMPIAVVLLVLYSYTKRFTWLCHIFLGLTIALSPLGGWVAVTGGFDLPAWLLYITVALWIAGFDIIYATQDFEFDRNAGLHSIPARFGIERALWIARSLHVVTAVGFIALFWMTALSWMYLLGTLISIALLFYQHMLVRPNDLSRVQTAFFGMNGTLSVVLFLFTIVDLLVIRQW
ncbi:putative 4-hydroxybenzoate polyprenyltransferase [Paenibacillus alkaliterrae]|uniref:UbiA-like polyprenyltransferase n=1 Tax=Paenibacillus alkaliterrae TaxID=320909 RepID=UPI001F22808E|nr:UbiA-like polyprenyltransferase [Paenibacillus alkaliterrae]MCF2937605.1 putative 4-hydroxybenzoate polyprenyltransferase [Paenibacillus alkaliterrae]